MNRSSGRNENRSKLVPLVLLSIVLLVGCGKAVILLPNGRPVPDQILHSNINSTAMTLEAAFIQRYGVKEGSETLDTYKFLPWFSPKPPYISPVHLQAMEVHLTIYNPQRVEYQLWLSELHKGQQEVKTHKQIYAGKLSFKEYVFSLPIEEASTGYLQFSICDSYGHVVFPSPKAEYKVGKSN